jgi:hypothetical protein
VEGDWIDGDMRASVRVRSPPPAHTQTVVDPGMPLSFSARKPGFVAGLDAPRTMLSATGEGRQRKGTNSCLTTACTAHESALGRSSTAVSPASPPRAKTCLGSNGTEAGATEVARVRVSKGDFPWPARWSARDR